MLSMFLQEVLDLEFSDIPFLIIIAAGLDTVGIVLSVVGLLCVIFHG